MEKLTNKRLYLDYNATSPLASSVVELMVKGDFPFGNPSSLHSSGKKALSFLRQAEQGILKLFACEQDCAVLFHSGATEGINTFIRGIAETLQSRQPQVGFASFVTDHPAVHSIHRHFEQHNISLLLGRVDPLGQYDLLELESFLHAQSGAAVLLNYTWVNNETGVVNDLSKLEALKKKFPNLIVHVDAVQAVGKVRNWWQLSKCADVYTFSGHKFGALKGTGFSIYRKNLQFAPLLLGGGQQSGFRSGTINVLGAYGQYLALIELKNKFDADQLEQSTDYLRSELRSFLHTKGKLVADGAPIALNTISFLIHGKKQN